MVSESELEGFRPNRYFARSWALLTRDRGWIKPVLVMTVALLVPVVGVLGVMGYALEWARLTAWGVNSAPKQRDVRVGQCIASGWRWFVVLLVWGIGMGLIAAVIDIVPLLGGLLAFLWSIATWILHVVVMVAALRATIYQRVRAGLRLSAIKEMVKRDPSGLMRIFGMILLGGLVIGVITFVVVIVCVMSMLPQLIYYAELASEFETILSPTMQATMALQMLLSVLGSMGPSLVVLALLDGFVSSVMALLSYTAVGLWMRQFHVDEWGAEKDPLPASVAAEAAATDPDDWSYPPAGAAASASAPAPDAAPAPESTPEPEESHGPILMPPAAPEAVEEAERRAEQSPFDASEPPAPDGDDPEQSEA